MTRLGTMKVSIISKPSYLNLYRHNTVPVIVQLFHFLAHNMECWFRMQARWYSSPSCDSRIRRSEICSADCEYDAPSVCCCAFCMAEWSFCRGARFIFIVVRSIAGSRGLITWPEGCTRIFQRYFRIYIIFCTRVCIFICVIGIFCVRFVERWIDML